LLQCPDCKDVCEFCLAPNEIVARKAKQFLEDQKVGIDDSLECSFGGLFGGIFDTRGSKKIDTKSKDTKNNIRQDPETTTPRRDSTTDPDEFREKGQIGGGGIESISSSSTNPPSIDIGEDNEQDKEKDRSGKQSGDGDEVSRPADATIMGSLLKSFFNTFGIAL